MLHYVYIEKRTVLSFIPGLYEIQNYSCDYIYMLSISPESSKEVDSSMNECEYFIRF